MSTRSSFRDLKIPPLNEFGTPSEIVDIFGGREKYLGVVRELQRALYS
jgi:type I restriction enzyme R subunit